MTRVYAFVFALGTALPCTAATGCTITNATNGSADVDASLEASAPNPCVAAGGQCIVNGSGCKTIGPQDCNPGDGPNGECCLDQITCPDAANAQVISVSSYDRSCTVDTDCASISEGNSCNPCDFFCANAAINVHALSQYMSDTANLPAVLAVEHSQCPSSCGGVPQGACCHDGTCIFGRPPQCPLSVFFPTDAATDAAAEASANAFADAGSDGAGSADTGAK